MSEQNQTKVIETPKVDEPANEPANDTTAADAKAEKAAKIKGVTAPEFDGVGIGTLRAWIRFYENEARCTDEELVRCNEVSKHDGFTRKDHVKVLTAEIDARKAQVATS